MIVLGAPVQGTDRFRDLEVGEAEAGSSGWPFAVADTRPARLVPLPRRASLDNDLIRALTEG